jgi:probable rRNA maturation factor
MSILLNNNHFLKEACVKAQITIDLNLIGAKIPRPQLKVIKKLIPHLELLSYDMIFSQNKMALNFSDKKIPLVEIQLSLCLGRKMRHLNHKYRKKNYATDVLSFPLYETLRLKKNRPQGPLPLGDLIICTSVAEKQAKSFSIGFHEEFIHLFIHGLLHLFGYDHEISLREEKIMEDLEKYWVELLMQKLKGTRLHE